MKEKTMDSNFRKHLQQRLHYGDMANLDVPSLPLTELAVDYFRDDVNEKLGQVDLYSASNVIRCNNVSPCSVVMSMLYAKRLKRQKQRNKDLLPTMSSADVFFISMMMASKYLYDEGVEEEVFNDVWADNTDQDVDDVNQMEIDFLQAMDWKLFVRPQEFEETLTAIERRLALQEGFKRGWYTYTEMDILMNSDLIWNLWTNVGSECSKMLSAISAAYLTSVLSLLGSTALAVHISGHLSSMTMSLLTLQSQSLVLAVSSGLSPSLPGLTLLAMPSSLMPGVPAETNESESRTPGFSTIEEPQSATWSQDGRWHGGLDRQLDPHKIPNSEIEGSLPDPRQATYNGYGSVSTKSSLWSLWFFDSLVSQMWAVICKTKLAYFGNWPVSGTLKERDGLVHADSGDGFTDRHTPQFQGQQSEQRKQYKEIPIRKLTTWSRTVAHKPRKDTKTHTTTQDIIVPAEALSHSRISSDQCSDLFSHIHPWQHSAGHCINGHQKHKTQSQSVIPKELSPVNLVIVHCLECLTHQSKDCMTRYCQNCLTHHCHDCLTHHNQDCLIHQRMDCLSHHSCIDIHPVLSGIKISENNTQPVDIKYETIQ